MKKITVFALCSLIILAGLLVFWHSNKNNEKAVTIMAHDKKTFKNISVNVKLRNVEFIITEDGTYGYEINDKSYSEITHEIRDSTLYISEKINYLLMYNYIFDMIQGLNRDILKIFIPKDSEFDTVSLKNKSGNTIVKESKCKSLDLSSTSGNISVITVKTENLKTRQTSGKLNIDGCVTLNNVDIISTSGYIFINNGSNENLKIRNTSGKVLIEGSDISNCEINKTSGKLEINKVNIRGLKISTTSGNTEISGVLTGKSDIISTSGCITLDIDGKKQDSDIYIDALSGKVTVDGEKQMRIRENQYFKSENGKNELRVKTTNGNVVINFD